MKKKYILFFVLGFLFSKGSFASEAANEKTIIKSDKIDKDSKDIIRAVGDVEIKKGDRLFNANEVEYNQSTKIITANSEVRVIDHGNDNIFFSESATMGDDFLNADFFNGVMVFKNGSNISSPHIRKTGENDLFIEKGRYSVCPTNIYDENLTYGEIIEEANRKKTPLFSLRSHKAEADTDKKVVKLWGTSIWFWKIPIFYMPYMKTGLAFQETANGFGIPGLENTKHYGYGVYIPYNITTKHQKITITPKIYEKGNYMANLKYNVISDDPSRWAINFKGDAVNDDGKSEDLTNANGITEKDEGDYRYFRGYAASNGYYNFNDVWDFGYNAAVSADRYYLRDYYQDGLSYIQSDFRFMRVDMQDDYNFNYFQFSNLFYQELLEKNGYNTPRYVPVTDFNFQDNIYQDSMNNLFYKIKFNTTSLFRKKGVEYNRFTVTPSINETYNNFFGTVNMNLSVKGDLYILNEVGPQPRTYDASESRLLPQFNFEWRKPFVAKSFLFQPILKYSGSPNSQSFEKHIPNEDSKPQAISFENIFSDNRFVGHDRQEFGNRITYGFDSMITSRFSMGLAQGYRSNIEDQDQQIIGFEDNFSDYVGYMSYIFNNHFDIYYRFLVNKDNFSFEKDEITINLNTDYISFYATYIDMDRNLLYDEKQRQLNIGMLLPLFSNWKISASTIIDFKNNNRLMESKAGLMYDGNCTQWEITYMNYNPMTETDRNTSVNFNFRIKFI